MEIEPISYNQYTEIYGESIEGYSLHCLAYLLQVKGESMSNKDRAHLVVQLKGTIYAT